MAMHFKLTSKTVKIAGESVKVWVASFKNSFTASRFADEQRKRGMNVFEPNPLVSREITEIEYWK